MTGGQESGRRRGEERQGRAFAGKIRLLVVGHVSISLDFSAIDVAQFARSLLTLRGSNFPESPLPFPSPPQSPPLLFMKFPRESQNRRRRRKDSSCAQISEARAEILSTKRHHDNSNICPSRQNPSNSRNRLANFLPSFPPLFFSLQDNARSEGDSCGRGKKRRLEGKGASGER